MIKNIESWLLTNEFTVLYWLSFSGFFVGLALLLGVLIHFSYFHRDKKSHLSRVISLLLVALAGTVTSLMAYNGSIFYTPPEEYNDQAVLKILLKLWQLITSSFLFIMVIATIVYYFKNMRVKG